MGISWLDRPEIPPDAEALTCCTLEEVAACLSFSEGQEVTVSEVRRLEFQALRKLRHELQRRGLTTAALFIYF